MKILKAKTIFLKITIFFDNFNYNFEARQSNVKKEHRKFTFK